MEFGNQDKSYLSKLVRQGANSFVSIGYQKITVSGSVQSLTIPTDAKYALCVVASSETTAIVARCLQNKGTTVAAGTGIPLKDGSTFDITMAQNLAGFQIIQEAAYTTYLYIEYFK